jgi:hypothetical protein
VTGDRHIHLSWFLVSLAPLLLAVIVVVAVLASLTLLRVVAGIRRPLEVLREEPDSPIVPFTSTARRKRDRWWR